MIEPSSSADATSSHFETHDEHKTVENLPSLTTTKTWIYFTSSEGSHIISVAFVCCFDACYVQFIDFNSLERHLCDKHFAEIRNCPS